MVHLGQVTLNELVCKFGTGKLNYLRCFHLNVQSISNKVDESECLFSKLENFFDIVMFTETWQYDDINIFEPLNMKTFSVYRSNRRGGGVSISITDTLHAMLVAEFCCVTADYEVVCVQLDGMIIAALYRPPDGSVPEFLNFLDKLFAYVNENNFYVVLSGDFNINMSDGNARKVDLENVLTCNGCKNFITTPTRITLSSETILDLLITNFDPSVVTTGVLSYPISDHMAIFCNIRKAVPHMLGEDDDRSYQPVSTALLDAFRLELGNNSFDSVFAATDANTAYNNFLSSFLSVYKNHFVFTRPSKQKGCRKPWMTRDLLKKWVRKTVYIRNLCYHVRNQTFVFLKLFEML